MQVFIHFWNKNYRNSNTPAMQAGLMKRPMTLEDIAKLIPEKMQGKRGSYKKKLTAG